MNLHIFIIQKLKKLLTIDFLSVILYTDKKLMEAKTMKQYRNFETSNRALKEDLTALLKRCEIYYELSSLYPYFGWHFEIFCTEIEAEMINNWLDIQEILA